METIIVPVDGATNIKLEILDFDTLTTVYSQVTESPSTEVNGLRYNCTGDECSWFDRSIREAPAEMKSTRAVAPVTRGASGGLIDCNNTLTEVPGEELTLSYTQEYPESVEQRFRELAGSEREYFLETGSVRAYTGSLSLIKRFLYEEMEHPGILNRSVGFGTYGILLSGHFLGDDYLQAVRTAGNEHSYWMCHSGARNINEPPGTPSSVCRKMVSFQRLVPEKPAVVYRPIGAMPVQQADSLGIQGAPVVIPGGHDTCLSHIPVMSTFYQAFPEHAGNPVLHVDAGSWTMAALIGGKPDLPPDGYQKGIIVQGTVDGFPVVTSLYGGGNDFRYMKELAEQRGHGFGCIDNESLLAEIAETAECFVLPNIHPMNHSTGPFPGLKGAVINEHSIFQKPDTPYIITNLATAITTAHQIDTIAHDTDIPIVLTAGGSKDPYFGRFLATFSGKNVYSMFDRHGGAITETTTLGAAICGKAACLNKHPYDVDVDGLGVSYRKLHPFTGEITQKLNHYRTRFFAELKKKLQQGV